MTRLLEPALTAIHVLLDSESDLAGNGVDVFAMDEDGSPVKAA